MAIFRILYYSPGPTHQPLGFEREASGADIDSGVFRLPESHDTPVVRWVIASMVSNRSWFDGKGVSTSRVSPPAPLPAAAGFAPAARCSPTPPAAEAAQAAG